MRVPAIAAALVLLGLGSSAFAADRSVLILPIEHEGLNLELVSKLDGIARKRVKKVLTRYRALPTPALGVADLVVAAGCTSDSSACFATIGKTVGATRVVRLQIKGSADNARLKVTFVKVRKKAGKTYEAKIPELGPDAFQIFGWHVEKGVGGKPAPLSGKVALLTEGGFGTLDGAEIMLDDAKASIADLENLSPGQHMLVIRQKGFETIRERLEVLAGRTLTVRVKFVPEKAAPPPPPPPPPPPLASGPPPPAPPPPAIVGERPETDPEGGLLFTWVFGGLTVASAATATYFGVSVINAENQIGDQNINCDATPLPELCDRGDRHANLATIMWIVTGGLGAATVLTFLLENPIWNEEDPAELSLGVMPSPDGGNASLRLRF